MSDFEQLARRAVACKAWRWLGGMLDCRTGLRVAKEATEADPRIGFAGLDDEWILGHPAWLVQYGHLPDLTDPATIGCLGQLIVDAWRGEVVITRGNGWWLVEGETRDYDQDNTDNFVEALVAALEAAGGVKNEL